VDDDCDGEVDEGFDLYDPCVVDRGTCRLFGTSACNAAGEAECRVDDRDVCNGRDDDCDGRVDEDGGFGSASCDTGIAGVCAAGHYQCVDGAPACAPAVEPRRLDELCNGVDDDCDGRIDEDVAGPPCYEGPDDTEGVGPCRGGTLACDAARYGRCVGEVLPAPERCDGVDDDCDGAVDEDAGDCACDDGAERPCPGPDQGACRPGTQRCAGGRWGACEGAAGPVREACNGVDDDCDGAVDEEAAGEGTACAAGLGICRRDGLWRCVDGALRCDAEPAVAREEVCNEIDDDCDGVVDDVPGAGQPCAEGVGECRVAGILLCFATGATDLVCVAEDRRPEPETCNALDDDCDGKTDEDCAAPPAP
jgi:hypothetical protein